MLRRILRRPRVLGGLGVVILASGGLVAGQTLGTAFVYQGRLTDGGAPASGIYDLEIKLFDAATDGAQVGAAQVLEDVSVANGLFTVALDFGSSAFAGNRRWLQIGVRPGASAGSFTPLGPRQELTPTPNALFALNALTVAGLVCGNGQVLKWSGGAWACGTDLDTDTNSGGTVTAVTAGSGLSGGTITGSGTIAIDETQVQRRVGGACPAGQYVREVNGDGTVVCGTDVDTDTNSGGTVTAITAGSGLSGGTITGSGTIGVAPGGITAAMIDQAQVQTRIGGSCSVGQYLRGINVDGTVICEPLPQVLATITTVDDAADDVGEYTSIAIGVDGMPVISYYDATAQALKVAHCGNATCTSGNTLSTVDDPANDVGWYTSIAIGADNLPIISYYDDTALALKVAHCGNATCTSGNTITTVDDTQAVGRDTSITIGADDLPIISYHDSTAGALKVAHCGNATCTSGNTLATIDDPDNTVGSSTSIAIGADDLPVISYRDASAGTLKVAHCGNTTCTSGNTLTTVDDPDNIVGSSTSIAIGPDDLPVIGYGDFTAQALKVAHCGNTTCTSGNTVTTVDDPAYSVVGSSIAIGADGLPVIAYRDLTVYALRVAHCGNATCTSGNTLAVVEDPVNNVGTWASIAIGTDGLPIISYYDFTAQALKVAHCATRTCQ